MMNADLKTLRSRARQIAAAAPPLDFYRNFRRQVLHSSDLFAHHPTIAVIHAAVKNRLDNDFGHGLPHVTRVSIDAGALLQVEGYYAGLESGIIDHLLCNVHTAGLLHDILRREDNHAARGAEYVVGFLADYPYAEGDIADISTAIYNHEAFRPQRPCSSLECRLVSDCLYDADKFRWGPDNFTDTVWKMLAFSDIGKEKLIQLFPKGLKSLEKIKDTFRTRTGRIYGPRFIDAGIAIGRQLFKEMQST